MSNYEFELKDFGDQCSQIIFCKRNRFFGARLALFTIVNAAACMYDTNIDEQLFLFPITVICSLVYIVLEVQKVHTECLTIISSLGVDIKQSSWITSKVHYFDIHHIKNIVIIEAVSMHSIICQLVLLPHESYRNSRNKGKMYPLFTAFHPRLEHLKTIYNHAQKKLIIPREKHGES